MRDVSLEDISGNFMEEFSRVQGGEIRIVSADGRPIGVLLTYEDFTAMKIKIDLAKDPRRLVEIVESSNRFQSGDLSYFEDYKFD